MSWLCYSCLMCCFDVPTFHFCTNNLALFADFCLGSQTVTLGFIWKCWVEDEMLVSPITLLVSIHLWWQPLCFFTLWAEQLTQNDRWISTCSVALTGICLQEFSSRICSPLSLANCWNCESHSVWFSNFLPSYQPASPFSRTYNSPANPAVEFSLILIKAQVIWVCCYLLYAFYHLVSPVWAFQSIVSSSLSNSRYLFLP